MVETDEARLMRLLPNFLASAPGGEVHQIPDIKQHPREGITCISSMSLKGISCCVRLAMLHYQFVAHL